MTPENIFAHQNSSLASLFFQLLGLQFVGFFFFF